MRNSGTVTKYQRKDRDEVRLKSIGSYLSKDSLKLARRILDDLE